MKNLIVKVIKKLFRIENLSLKVKKWKKGIFKRIYTKKYSADDLVAVMQQMGMKSGSIVFIHSSMTEFYNFVGTPTELIDKIINVIGPDGTLMMPAYPKDKSNLMKKAGMGTSEILFDLNCTPSGAGYLTEVFRKYPNVMRSINIQHSVCAWGRLAEYFTSEHHFSKTAWDEFSPYYKMSRTDTLVFAFGLPYFLGTMIHCTESILRSKYVYFSLLFRKQCAYHYKDWNGNIGEHTFFSNDVIKKEGRKRIIKEYFNKEEFNFMHISNLRIEMVKAKYTLDLYLELAELGITMYSKPSPKPFLNKDGKFIKCS